MTVKDPVPQHMNIVAVGSAEEQMRDEIVDHQRFLDRVGPAEDFASRLVDEQLRARIATLEAELKEPTT
jgi:hypothetical protein